VIILLNEYHSSDSVHSGLPQTSDLSRVSGLSWLIESAFCLTVLTRSGRLDHGLISQECVKAGLILLSWMNNVLVTLLLPVFAARFPEE
jgi:hypothetical protein